MVHLFDNMPRYHCSERCKAPNEFYSGSPFLSFPSDGILEMKQMDERVVEWQFWTQHQNINLTFLINNDQIQNDDPNGLNVDGKIFKSNKTDIQFAGKFLRVRATIRIQNDPIVTNWNISVQNEKGGMLMNKINLTYIGSLNLNFFSQL